MLDNIYFIQEKWESRREGLFWKIRNLKRVLKRYVDDVSSYYSKKYKGEIYSLDKGGKKILEVAIPPVEMSKAQANVFDEIVSYAKEKGVTVITRIIG